jgi:hypothetical protein
MDHSKILQQVPKDLGGGLTTTKRYATPADWDLHRHIIERLYLDEDKTLDKVKSIMSTKYGLNAT